MVRHAWCTFVGLSILDEPLVKFLQGQKTLPVEEDAAIDFLVLL